MDTVKAWKDMTGGERVVHATKQTSYAGVIAVGLGVTGSYYRMLSIILCLEIV